MFSAINFLKYVFIINTLLSGTLIILMLDLCYCSWFSQVRLIFFFKCFSLCDSDWIASIDLWSPLTFSIISIILLSPFFRFFLFVTVFFSSEIYIWFYFMSCFFAEIFDFWLFPGVLTIVCWSIFKILYSFCLIIPKSVTLALLSVDFSFLNRADIFHIVFCLVEFFGCYEHGFCFKHMESVDTFNMLSAW